MSEKYWWLSGDLMWEKNIAGRLDDKPSEHIEIVVLSVAAQNIYMQMHRTITSSQPRIIQIS